MISADVLVVGAGPGGCATAITLARAGLDVVMVDKARFPRDKCCGDGLTTMALRRLAELGLDPVHVPSWSVVQDVHLRAPGGRVVDLRLPAGPGLFAAVARRSDLDAALVELARRAGARVLEGTALRSAHQGGDRVVATLDPDAVVGEAGAPDAPVLGTGVQARYVIGADGMWSPLRKALGLADRSYRGDWHAFRQYMTAPGEQSREMWVWFEPDLLPGYAWSFPLPGGRANVGFGVPRQARLDGARMARTWRDLLERPHVAHVLGAGRQPEAPHRAWPIPARLPRTRLAAGRCLFVGDAAAATDPMTGEGIGQALQTGILAARAVLGGGALQPDVVARTYTRSVRRSLVADHHMAAGLSAVLGSRRATDLALALVDRGDWTRSHFARWMFEDEPRAAALTPRRWHRSFLRRPGAILGAPAAAA